MRRLFTSLMFVILLPTLSLPISHAQDSAPYRFAYISGADKEIWIVNADGSEARQITHDGKGNTTTQTLIAASPDGHFLAYFTDSWYVTGSNPQIPQGPGAVYKLAVLNLHTGEQVLLTEQDSFGSVVWSPDSQQLAFAWFDPPSNPDYCMRWKAYVMQRDGSNRREIGHGKCSTADLHWSPDGSTILFTSKEAGDEYAQLYAMNPDGSNVRRLTNTEACFICYHAQWMPDSQSIVFYHHPDLFIMQADGSDLRPITNFEEVYNVIDVAHARYDQPDFAIAADSQSLVYLMGYPLQLVKLGLQPDGWEQRRILAEPLPSEIYARGLCCLAPDGRTVYYLGADSTIPTLYSLNIEKGGRTPLLHNVGQPLMVNGQR